MSERYDAIVIGAGVIGSAVGLELARKGYKTLNIDKLPAAGYGSTSGSCAIIRTYYSTVDGSALAFEGYYYWKNWKDYLQAPNDETLAHFHETGTMVTRCEANGFMERAMEIADEIGVPYQLWSNDEIRAKMPHYNLDCFYPAKRPEDDGFGEPTGGEVGGAIFFPYGGYINDPQLSAHNLRSACERAGGSFKFNAEIVEINKDSTGAVSGVTLKDGTKLEASIVVNVAGPHSAKVNAMAGALDDMNVTTRALKQEVAHVPMPVEAWYENGWVTSDSDIACYTRPERGNFLLIGSEDPPCDHQAEVDPDDWDRNFSEQWKIQAMRVAQRIPSLGIPSQMKGVTELYDTSDDWIPIYDKSQVPGYYMAIGSSGNQYKNAPVAGVMMAELIDAEQKGRDHDKDPVTLHMKYTGRDLDIGFFSRRRVINKDSSFSVLG
jgi:sarcosine oxidase subunit beta